MKKGDVIVLGVDTPADDGPEDHCHVWYNKTPEDIEDEKKYDKEAEYFFDSAGEPLLYCSVGALQLKTGTTAIVTKTSNVRWSHWNRKPRFLVEGIITSGRFLGRTVMFVNEEKRNASANKAKTW